MLGPVYSLVASLELPEHGDHRGLSVIAQAQQATDRQQVLRLGRHLTPEPQARWMFDRQMKRGRSVVCYSVLC